MSLSCLYLFISGYNRSLDRFGPSFEAFSSLQDVISSSCVCRAGRHFYHGSRVMLTTVLMAVYHRELSLSFQDKYGAHLSHIAH